MHGPGRPCRGPTPDDRRRAPTKREKLWSERHEEQTISHRKDAGAALGRRTLHPFELGGRRLHVADLVVAERWRLVGRRAADLERAEGVRVVLLSRAGSEARAPAAADELAAGDAVAVVAAAEALVALDTKNRPG